MVDVGDVLRNIDDARAQDWLTDVTNVDEIVIPRTDVELDVELAGERSAFVNNFGLRR